MKKELVGNYDNPDTRPMVAARQIPMYRETLPNGVSYLVLDAEPNGPGDNTDEYVVPPGHYFMMGDNRDNSHGQPLYLDAAVASWLCAL